MKTLLYKDSKTNEIKTFEILKNEYAEENNSDLPILDEDMQLIIFNNLVQNGGNLILIKDDILAWCNDYSDYQEADRYLSPSERDENVYDLYFCIINKVMEPLKMFLMDLENDLKYNIPENNTESRNEVDSLIQRLKILMK